MIITVFAVSMCVTIMLVGVLPAYCADVTNKSVPLYDGKPGKKIGDKCTNPKDGAEMVWVPAGEFLMGSSDEEIADILKNNSGLSAESLNDEKPQRKVHLDGYWIYKNKVTVHQYRKFCRATKRKMIEPPKWGSLNDDPMVYVNWKDAADYARWAGVSLPTEAQWEKAARGTDGRIYPWGSDWPPPSGAGNFPDESLKAKYPDVPSLSGYEDGYAEVSPIGKFPAGASPYGCMDMAGNIFEFCNDWYDSNYYRNASDRNPIGPPYGPDFGFTGRHVYRGSSWRSELQTLRCASRSGYHHAQPQSYIGFRCAATTNCMSGQTFIFNQDSHDLTRAMLPGQALEWARDYHRRVFEAGVGVFVADIAFPDAVETRDTPTGEILGARFGVEYEDKVVGQDSASGPYNRVHHYRRNAELIAQGTDVLRIACEEGRKVGGVVLAGMRMNDSHQGYKWKAESDAPNMTLFMMAHPEWCNTWKNGDRDCTLNYAVPEVQAHRLQILREIATNYAIDGLELNWMRWPRHFPEGTQRAHLKDLTRFVSQVRAMLDEVSRKKGVARMTLGHRVAATVGECLDIGCDVETWSKQGYADFLVPMDFLQNDPNLRTDEFVKAAEGTGCLVYPSFASMTYSFGPRDNSYGRASMRTLDQFRATAANWYAWGAAGGSCFNMYLWAPSNQDFYTQAIGVMSNPKMALAGARHYVYLPTWKDHGGGICPTGRFNAQSLTFGADTVGKRQVFTFRMADGRNGEKLEGTMHIRIFSAVPENEFEIDLNGKAISADRFKMIYSPKGEIGGQPVAGSLISDGGTFDWPANLRFEVSLADCPKFNGDNELGITLKKSAVPGANVPVMEALEVKVR